MVCVAGESDVHVKQITGNECFLWDIGELFSKQRISRLGPEVSNIAVVEVNENSSGIRRELSAEQFQQRRLSAANFSDDRRLSMEIHFKREGLNGGLVFGVSKPDIFERYLYGQGTGGHRLTRL